MSDILDKINQICRICLLEQSIMHSIFHQNDSYQEISQMLKDFTTIKIDLNDNLPQLVCSSCLERLGIAFSFKRDCERSDQILRKLTLENEQKFDIKPFITYNALLQNEGNFADPDFVTGNISEFVKVEIKDDVTVEQEESIKNEQDEHEVLQLSASENESDDSLNLLEIKKKIINKSKNGNTEENSTVMKKNDNREKIIYECQVCKKTFKEHILLWRHRKKVHLYFSCYVCWKQFSNLVSLHKHDEEHQDKTYICDRESCFLEFINFRLFLFHKKNDHGIEKYLQCSECDMTFVRHKQWNIHVQQHLYNRFRCELCQAKFASDNEFEDHISAQHPDYLTCSTCLKRCENKKSFDCHVATHSTFVCDECGKQFKRKNILKEHIKYKHQGVPKKRTKKYIEKSNHLCPICGAAYNRPSRLQLHLQRHAGVKAFACELCDHRTTSDNLLRSHMRTHTGERPFVCDICGKTFAFKGYLTIHKRWHTGDRPYKCTFSPCDKGFTTKQDLKVHERSHTGVKLFQCQICNSSFTTLHYLKVHTAKHGDSGNA